MKAGRALRCPGVATWVVAGALGLFAAARLSASDPFLVTREISGQALLAEGDVELRGGAVVDSVGLQGTAGGRGKGHVVAGGDIRLSGRVRVDGDARFGPSGRLEKDGSPTVTGEVGPLTGPPASAAIDLSKLAVALEGGNDNSRLPPTLLGRPPLTGTGGRSLVVGDGDRLELPEGTYLLDELRLEGSAVVTVEGRVRVLVRGPVRLGGRSRLNPESGALFLRLWTTGHEFTVDGDASLRAFVHAPAATASVVGNAILTGGLRASSIRVDGQARVTRLAEDGPPLSASFTESGSPIATGAVFSRPVRPEATPSPRVPLPEMTLTLDGAPFRSGDVVSTAGDHVLGARLQDVLGRDAEVSVTFRIVEPGGDPPRLSILSPAAGAVRGASPVEVAGSAGTSVSVEVNGIAAVISNGGFAAHEVPLVEGGNSLVASGRDQEGRIGTARSTVVLDTVPPAIAILESGLPLAEGRVFARGAVPVVSVVEANPGTTALSLDSLPFASGTRVVLEGAHELAVVSEDRAGNRAARSVRFSVDTTPPDLAITQPAPGSVVRTLPAELFGTCGRDAVRVSSAGRVVVPVNGTFLFPGYPFVEGRGSVVVTAVDEAGNESKATAAYLVDVASPLLDITSPVEGAILGPGPIFVRGTATDTTLGDVTVDGVAANLSDGGGFSAGPFSRADGPASFTASAVDGAGRVATATVKVTVDTAPPIVSVRDAATGAALAPGALLSVAPVLEVVVTDTTTPERTTAAVRVDGASYGGGPVTGEGAHGIDVVATDGAGNVTAMSATFTLDTTAPVFRDLLPEDGGVGRGANVTISGSVSGDAVGVTVNGVAATLAGGRFSRGGIDLVEGPNVVSLRAEDGAGNPGTATLRLVLDTTAPSIAFSEPAIGSLLGALTTNVAGTVSDANLESVAVDGGVATVDGGVFRRAGVLLVEGANTLTATARDRAGNTASAMAAVSADTEAPVVSIGSPVAGAILGASPATVTGSVADAHLATVTVNGVPAALEPGGRFRAEVPLAQGRTTLVATAKDTLGRGSAASVEVTLDSEAPAVTIASPADGARFRSTPQRVVVRLASLENVVAVNVNGLPAARAGEEFAVDVPLVEGFNPLTARARKSTDREGTASVAVTLDSSPPRLVASVPTDGQTGVALSPEIRLTFSEELDAATAVPGAFHLGAEGAGEVLLTVATAGPVVTVSPATPLPDARLFELTLAPPLADLAGNPLAQTAIRFSTVDETSPAGPVLDPMPARFCAVSRDLTGSAEPGSLVVVSGGAAVAQGPAGADGRFRVPVTLRAGAHQTLVVTARDAAGNASPAATVSLTNDCAAPRVVEVLRAATDVTVEFDEPVDRDSLRPAETVRLDETTGSGAPIGAAVALSADGVTLTITAPGRDLGALGFSLALTSGVADLAGNSLEPFVRSFAPLNVETVLVGELFDDTTSRPLGAGSATLLLAGGRPSPEPQPRASVTRSGAFAIPAVDGDALVRLSAPGYLDVWRRASVTANVGTAPSETLFDARLTPASPHAANAPRDGGTLFAHEVAGVGGERVTLFAPSGSLPSGTIATLTPRSPQALPVLPPLGWSVAGAVQIRLLDPAGAPAVPSAPLTLSLPDRFGADATTPLTLARLDTVGLAWIDEGPAALVDGALDAMVTGPGDWAVLVPDPSPTAPPASSPGVALAGVVLPASDPLESAAVVASPTDVLASQTAEVSLTVASASPVPSGFPVQCLVTEELTLLDGSTAAAPPYLADLLLQRRGDGTTGLAVSVRASDVARRSALSIGWERFAVKKFPFEVRQGTVVSGPGGTVSGPGGWSLDLPAGAVSVATSVTLTPLSSADLPAIVPGEFTFLAAVRVGTGGAAFSLPARLSTRLAAAPAAGQDLLLAFLDDRTGVVAFRAVARGTWDPATSMLSTRSIERAAFPWPGVHGEGTYLFLSAVDPLAFAAGRLYGLDSAALAGLDVRVAGWPLVALTEGDGSFALALRVRPEALDAVEPAAGDVAGLTIVPAAPGAEITGVELRVVATPPWVTSTSPPAGQTVLVHSVFAVELSEPLDPLSITPGSVSLVAVPAGGAALLVAARVDVPPGSRSVLVTPEAPLPGNARVVLALRSSLSDLAGRGLVDRVTGQPADFVVAFMTEDLTPPDARPWLVTIGLPAGEPTPAVEIVGAPGAVCPGCRVVAWNDSTQATAATDALSDGSFRVTLAARAGDAIRIEIEKANGTRQTLPQVPFTGEGGRTAIVGPAGGTWQTPEGHRFGVPQGAFVAPVTVTTGSLSRASLDTLVAPPRDVAWVDSFTLDVAADGAPVTATTGFDLSFAAPAAGGATNQFLLAQVVEVFGERRFMVVDLLVRSGDRLVTDRSGQALQTLAQQGLATLVETGPPGASTSAWTVVPASIARPLDAIGGAYDRPSTFFDGVVRSGTYALYNTATLMAVVAGTCSGATLLATSSESDFVFSGLEVLTRNLYRLVTPAGRLFELTLRDVGSGLSLFQGEVTPGVDPNRVTPVDPPIRLDPEPPAVLSASPAFVHRFLAPPTYADGSKTDVAHGIRAAATASGVNVRVELTGSAGAVPAGAIVRLQNVSAEEGEPGAGRTETVAAASDGSFPAFSIEAVPGDRLSLAVDNTDVPLGTSIVVRFDRLVKSLPAVAWRDVIRLRPDETGAGVVELRFEPGEIDGATRAVVAVPQAPLERGRKYLLAVSGVLDTGTPGKAMAAAFEVGFSSPRPEAVSTETTGFVRKVLAVGGLLFETGDSNDIKVRDISRQVGGVLPPPCGSAPLPGPGRDLALDAFGRLVCVGGGTDGFGFLKVFDIVGIKAPGEPPVTAGACAGQLNPAGSAVVSSQLGGDNAAFPPGGIPRRVSFHQPLERETWVVGRTPPPKGFESRSAVGVRLPYELAGAVEPGPDPARPRMVKLTNVTTGESTTRRVAPGAGSILALPSVSRGDLLSLEIGTFSVAVVDVLGFGLSVVDLEVVYVPESTANSSPSDPAQAAKLLLVYDGSSSGGGVPCDPAKCDRFQRCPASGSACELFATPPDGYGNLGLPPVSSLAALADAVVLPKSTPDEEFTVVGALNGYGLAAFSVDLLGRARPAPPGTLIRGGHVAGLLGHLPLKRSTTGMARAVGVAVAREMTRPANAAACPVPWPSSPSGDPSPRDLAFVAAGESGVFVVDVTEPRSMRLVGRLETEGGALTVSVDARRRLLYVGDAGQGVSVFDVSDPCGETAEGLAADPRRVAVFRFGVDGGHSGTTNVPVEFDPDTGFAFATANQATGTAGLLGAYALVPPPIYAVADTDQNGSLEVVGGVVPLGVENPSRESAFRAAGIPDPDSDPVSWPRREDGTSHDPYVPDHFRILAFLPGGAGETVEAEVAATSPEGLDLPPGAPGFPRSGFTVERGSALTLRRQSQDPAQPSFNRYLSDPVVVLADPRAQLAYERTPAEISRKGFPGGKSPFACRNCDAAADLKDGLLGEGTSAGQPGSRLELWSGDRIRISLASSLAARLVHLEGLDLRSAGVVLDSVRGDLTPGTDQRPVLSESSVLGVSTHSLELVVGAIDAEVPGRQLSVVIDRTYASQVLHDGPLGRNWDSALFERLRPLPSGNVDYYDGGGRRLTFEVFDRGETRSFVSPEGLASVLALGKDGRYYLVEPDRSITVFDEYGRKLAFQDRRAQTLSGSEGNRHRFIHDPSGRLVGIRDDLGRSFALDYDELTGRLKSLRDFEGREVRYEYDVATGALLKNAWGFDPVSPESTRPRTEYFWAGVAGGPRSSLFSAAQLVSEADADGKSPYEITWSGPVPGSVEAVRLHAEGGVTGFELARADRLATVTEPGGFRTAFEHDAQGHPLAVVDPKLHRTEMSYLGGVDPRGGERNDGLLGTVKPPLGNAVVLEYDRTSGNRASQFNLKKVTRRQMTDRGPAVLVSEIPEYDSHNLPKRLVAQDGKVTEIHRDQKGDPEVVSLPGNDPFRMLTDGFGRVKHVAGTARTVALSYDDEPGKTGGLKVAQVLGGEGVSLDRDSRGNVTTITDGELRQTRLTWNRLDQLEREERGSGATRASARVRYDASGLPRTSEVLVSAPEGGVPVFTSSTYDFDSLGRLSWLTSSDAGTTTLRYDPRGNLRSVEDATGGRVAFTYEARGLLETVTDPSGAVTILSRNANGTPESIEDPRHRVTRFIFDGFERVVGVDDGVGAVTSLVRDAAGRVRVSKVFNEDAEGKPKNLFSWTELDYDAGGRPLRRVRKLFEVPSPDPVASDVITEWRRDGAGRVVEEQDPLGRITKTDYDAAGRVWRVTDALGNSVEITYDGGGRKKTETRRERDQDGNVETRVTEFTYDEQGRLWKINAPGNRVTEYRYDGRGLKTKEIDPDGGITRFEHDLAGRLTKRIDPLGYVTRWEHDAGGRLTKVVDANGHATTYARDARGLLLAETRGEPVNFPRGTNSLPTWYSTWDALGNRETATDPNGTEQTFTYDGAGRITGRTVRKADGVSGIDSASFTLDVLGRAVADTALAGPTRVEETRRFDSLGRALEESLRIGTGPERRIHRVFDSADNPVSLTYPSGRVLSRDFDPLNRLAVVRSESGDLLARYEDLGARQLRRILGNGLGEERGYDASGWLSRLGIGPTANPNGTFSVTYDRNGRSLKTDARRLDLGRRHHYEYDAAGRILREQLGLLEPPPSEGPNLPQVENYLTLDGLLNIVTEERTEAGAKVTTTSARNSRNQVTSWGGDLATWDANGNVKAFRGRTYRYDADNRFVSADVPGGSYEVLRDASGRKVRETLTSSGSSHAVDVVQDGDRTLETFTANEGVPLESLVYGRGIDEVVRADLDPDGDGVATTVVPIQDELGNVAYLTGLDGAVLERYDYETYGRFRVFAPDGTPRSASAYGWTRLFQGREYLAALEAYDFRNRLLLPSLGRFAQEDPLGYVDSLNLYQAFGGSWVNATDPWGLESSGAFGAIDRRDRGITNPIAGTIDPEAVAREAAATAVEELSYLGVANGLSSSLLAYDFIRKEEVKGPLARVLAAVSVVPGIPATIRKIDDLPWARGATRHGLADVDAAIRLGPERQLPAASSAAVRRGAEGVSFAQSLPVVREGQQWLRGTGRDAGRVPGQIAERLTRRKFGSFDDFRRAFWTEVSQDAVLSKQFGPNSLREMQAGRAPFAPGAGQAGERIKYELDHLKEIQAGGSVYDMNNLVIRTPVNHIGK